METINIDAKEVIEWVTQRRKLKSDWNQKLKALDNKARTIVHSIKNKSIPELEDVFKDQDDDEVDYLLLKEISEGLVKSKEGEERNFFGQYKSQSIRDVHALMRLYEKEFLHFAGLAQHLVQLVTYEIPYCRKVSKTNQHSVRDLEYKISACESSIGHASREILKLIAKYDPESEMCEDEIDKFSVNAFIEGFVKSLGSRVGAIEDKMSKLDIDKITSYYTRFSLYNSGAIIDPSQFSLIKALKRYGDILVSDFHNNRASELEFKEKPGLYDNLLFSKGFGNSDLVLEEQQWEIEDVDTAGKRGHTNNEKTADHVQSENDTIITNRETREEALESLYEVNLQAHDVFLGKVL